MRLRRGRLVLGSLALGSLALASMGLVAIGVVAPAAGVAAPAAHVADRSVRPVPYVTGHTLTQTLSFPPTTAYCEQNFAIACYQPAQYQLAYDLQPLYARGLDGAGSTIVIVDSFGSPTITNDLHVFDQTFGLADPPSFQIIQPAGTVPAFPADPFGLSDRLGWATETTLDVEWAHAMAPGANILLAETPTSETQGVQGFPEIVAAENYVIDHNLGDVISQSFGATEQTFPSPIAQTIGSLRGAVVNAAQHHVTVLGSSGDFGATDAMADLSCCYPYPVNSWPSSDPLVTSVGGTQLALDARGHRLAPDVVWNDGFGAGGGGLSSVFTRPDFQTHVRGVVGGSRGTPDVSLSAAVNGAAVIYFSFANAGFHLVGGTSEASPLFAGIVAIADQAVGHRLGDLNPLLYSHIHFPGIVDVTSGNNSFHGVTGYSAGPGYDLASGLGTIDAYNFVTGVAHLTRH